MIAYREHTDSEHQKVCIDIDSRCVTFPTLWTGRKWLYSIITNGAFVWDCVSDEFWDWLPEQ